MAKRTAGAESLTVLPPVAEGRLYPVASGAKTYFVDPETGECDCPFWQHRCYSNYRLCKHARAVRAHLEREAACPTCRGQGVLRPSGLITYILPNGEKDEEAIPCLVCDGTGKR